jgi:UDP:flavonoid glycosyltransferase YjiC (YdhE family)
MKVIIVALGSLGDNNPLVTIGAELRKRGCTVVVLGCDWYKDLICNAGLTFHSILSSEEAEKISKDPYFWDQEKSFSVMVDRMYAHTTWPVFDFIKEHYEPERTLVISSLFIFGARLAQEALRVPLVTIRINAFALWNVDEKQNGAFNSVLNPVLNKLCKRINVSPNQSSLYHWMYSPKKIIGLFPDWFESYKNNWPSHIKLTHFLLMNESKEDGLSAELKEYLSVGEPPIVFTPGSVMRDAKGFFSASLQACLKMGRRGVFLSPYREQIPPDLPSSFRHFDFIPLDTLLPYASGIVYHGGIGTCAQGLRAGIPHLVAPKTFEQSDNAGRLKRLGVGDSINRDNYNKTTVSNKLETLLNSENTREHCRKIKGKFDNYHGVSDTCDEIVSVVK